MKITVVDSIMGSGKTSWAIQKMNEETDSKFIYITPLLSEITRIRQDCKFRNFVEPEQKGNGKLYNLHEHLSNSRNIAATHALFKMSNEITKGLLECNNYTLILDEVMDVIEQIALKKDDLPTMINEKFIIIDEETKIVRWNNDLYPDYDGAYNLVRDSCQGESVFLANNCLLMWTFPVDIFSCFKEVYILTYLFKGQVQRYYYDMFKLEYNYAFVNFDTDTNKYVLNNDYNQYTEDKQHIRDKITILIDDNLNAIGRNQYALSSTWYTSSKNKQLLTVMKNNLYNFFRNKTNSTSEQAMWTTFKQSKNKLRGKGYTNGFVEVNIRATNKFGHKTNLAYCVNYFLNPIVETFFAQRDIAVDEDTFALAEMLQWIWRSAIRNDNAITIYVPSVRMRTLLSTWLGVSLEVKYKTSENIDTIAIDKSIIGKILKINSNMRKSRISMRCKMKRNAILRACRRSGVAVISDKIELVPFNLYY